MRCNESKMISYSLQDVIGGKRDHLGVHNTGNVVLKLSSIDNGYIVIDGQQRITTTTLFLAALRLFVVLTFRLWNGDTSTNISSGCPCVQ